MKKRLFTLALVVGVLLSVCASAWAWDGYTLRTAQAEYTKLYKIDARAGLSFGIRLRASIPYYSNPINASGDDFGTSADVVEFTVTSSRDIFSGDLVITPVSCSLSATPAVYEAILSGTLSDNISSDGDVIVHTQLKFSNNNSKFNGTDKTSEDVTIVFTTENGTEERNSNFPAITGDTVWGLADMFDVSDEARADPDSDFWDGIEPIFYSDPGKNEVAKAKAKLSTSKVKDFTSGTADTAQVEITGPVTEVDVYIAGKDAVKLWPDSADKNTDIQLTRANIKAYKIPFRITVSNDSGNLNKLTGSETKDGKKKDKETAKKMKTTFTLAFNGANVAYKGFPLTFSVKNDEMKKAAAKALKINVKPLDNVPDICRYEDKAGSKVISVDIASGYRIGMVKGDAILCESDEIEANDDNTYPSDESYYDENGEEIEETLVNFTYLRIESGEVSYDADGYAIVSTDAEECATVYYTYNYTKPGLVKYDKSKRPNWDISVPLTAETEAEIGSVENAKQPTTFYVSGDSIAPYNITVKGEKNGVEAEVTQPVYDNLGNLKKPGYVTIGGQLENTAKETKTAITITATNPSTKKKGSVKVTVIGKLPATFNKDKFVDAPDASSYTDDYGKGAYGKVLSTKYVEAGKVPSATFKATGSKTITYEIVEGGDELVAAGLSFNANKGKIIALGAKDKVVPTVDTNGDFAPADILVRATNGIDYLGDDGANVARALIGVTGGKPAVYEKTVTYGKSDMVSGDYVNGSIKPFKLSAGKDKPAKAETANVKATTEDDLASLGLELITWESLDKVVSAELTASSGDTIRTSPDLTPIVIVSGDSYDVTSGDIIASGDGVIIYKMGNVTQHGDEDYKNMGIFRVTDYTKMVYTKKLKVNLALENIGSTATGSVTLVISETTSSSKGDGKARKTVAVDSTAGTKAKNGTAGSKNGTALPDGAKTEADEAAEEATVTVGAPRTAADLTAAQQAFLAEKGYKVIAVLPEISATAEGQQDFEVELDEDAPEGEKMIYVPFPQDVEETEDDSFAEFFDAEGAEIEEVPAEKAIVAAPWLRADVVYQPVIVVEAGE